MARPSNVVGANERSELSQGVTDMAALDDGAPLSERAEKDLAKLFESLGDGGDTGLRARFKLEVAFSEQRSLNKPFAGIIAVWASGGFMHGGGDVCVYFCPHKIETSTGSRTCATPLPIMTVGKRIAVCPGCRRASDPRDLVGQVVAKLPMQHWVTLITKMFRQLDHNADIRMGTLVGDLRKANLQESTKERRGDDFAKVRLQRRWVVYPLKHIIKDTAAGSTLPSRIRSFLYA
jgi:hypothetical protein